MFFKVYIKICETAAPIKKWIFLLTVKSVVKKVITRATPGRSLVLYVCASFDPHLVLIVLLCTYIDRYLTKVEL